MAVLNWILILLILLIGGYGYTTYVKSHSTTMPIGTTTTPIGTTGTTMPTGTTTTVMVPMYNDLDLFRMTLQVNGNKNYVNSTTIYLCPGSSLTPEFSFTNGNLIYNNVPVNNAPVYVTVDATTKAVTCSTSSANAAAFKWARNGTITHTATGQSLTVGTNASNQTILTLTTNNASAQTFAPEILTPVQAYINLNTGNYNDIPGLVYVSAMVGNTRGWLNANGGISDGAIGILNTQSPQALYYQNKNIFTNVNGTKCYLTYNTGGSGGALQVAWSSTSGSAVTWNASTGVITMDDGSYPLGIQYTNGNVAYLGWLINLDYYTPPYPAFRAEYQYNVA